MARLVPTLIVAFLLAGTAAAFAVTQRLKQELSPIFGTRIGKVAGPRVPAVLSFRLREADTVTATIVDGDGETVRTLINQERRRAGRLAPPWDGATDDGGLASEGVYHLRVRLADQRRTIELPDDIRLDRTPPELTQVAAGPGVFSPDGDGRADRVTVRYGTNEDARALLFVDAANQQAQREHTRDHSEPEPRTKVPGKEQHERDRDLEGDEAILRASPRATRRRA